MKPVGIRPIEAEDSEALRELFGRLSPATVYLRFFQPIRTPNEDALHHFAEVDHDRREAIAAVVGDRIVGVARYDRSADDPTRAEMAIVVEDDWQGQGLGLLLLSRLMDRALDGGVTTFTASVLGQNTRMLSLAKRLVPARRVTLDHGEWELEMPLAAG
jgi:GNAT superfamily N-acetyltransferase